jgi:hypothetical protein
MRAVLCSGTIVSLSANWTIGSKVEMTGYRNTESVACTYFRLEGKNRINGQRILEVLEYNTIVNFEEFGSLTICYRLL